MTRRLCLPAAVACALAIAAPAHAQRFIEHHTIEVHTETTWPGRLVAFGGLYWGTGYGVCPAGPIHVTFEQSRRPVRDLGEVPATSVIPFSGGFSDQMRLPDDAHLGAGTLRFVQHEREVSSSGRCTDARSPGRQSVGLRLQRRPPGPCTPADGCATTPDPTLEIVTPPGPPHQPGGSLHVVGHDYPDPGYDPLCPGKQGQYLQTIAYYLTDASGSATRLYGGRFEGEVVGHGDVEATLGLPSYRLAPGRASLSAVPIGYEGDPVCGRPGTTTFTVTVPRPTLTFTTAPAAGASVTLNGAWWRTDRCDSRVDIVLDRRGVKHVLKRVRPGPLGAFDATVKVPRGKGENRILAVQRRALEVADPLGRPKRSRCVRRPRTIKTKRVTARKAPAAPPAVPGPIGPPAPAPTPAPTPEPTPAPTPDPTLEARQTGADSVQVAGTHWERGDCGGKANPVTITLAHAGKPAETIGTATPDAAGAFTAEFKPVTVAAGDETRASQQRCDGSALSAAATVT